MFSTADKIAFAAAFFSGISMFVSWRSFVYAKRSYRISKNEHDKKSFGIATYLIDAVDWKDKSEKYSSFAVSYTNQATEANSIAIIELELDCYDRSYVFHKVKLRPEANVAPVGLSSSHQQLPIPLNLDPKTTVTGWLTFKIPITNEQNWRIDTYRLVGTTTDEKRIEIESFIHRNVVNEKQVTS